MVEVFTTDVQQAAQAEHLILQLREVFPNYSVNFDLQDCDHILTVESPQIDSREIIMILNCNNFRCEILT